MWGTQQLTHLIGIVSALTTLALVGAMVSYFWGNFPVEFLNNWSTHDPHGLMPGVIEESKEEISSEVGGMYPYICGAGAAIFAFVWTYLVSCGMFLSIVFFGELFIGWSPASFPTLYYIGAFALLVGFSRMEMAIEETFTSKRNLGYRGF